MCKIGRKKRLTRSIVCSLLAASVLTVGLPMQNVFAEEPIIDPVIWTNEVFENTEHGGDWGKLQRTDLTITGSTFKNNSNTGNEGANGGAFSTYGGSKQLTVNISNSTFESNKAVTTSNRQGIGHGALGGAIMIKGSALTLNDVVFTNNIAQTTTGEAFAGGGAIYLDSTENKNGVFPTTAKIIATKNMTYSGNNVVGASDNWYANSYGALAQSGGGFMFLDRNSSAEFEVAEGATLTIGNTNASGDMDSIASATPEAGRAHNAISKTGAGTLTINSDLNKYYGTLAVSAGVMNVNKDWTIKNEVAVTGGKLSLANVTLNKIPDKITDVNGKEYDVVAATGTITVDGGTVSAKNLNATNGKVILKKGALNVAETYTGDILATGGSSEFQANKFNGSVEAKGSTLAIKGKNIEFEAPTVDYSDHANSNKGKEFKHTSLFVADGATVTYGNNEAAIDKMVFNSANITTNDPQNTKGTDCNAAVITGESTLDIHAKELYVGTAEQGGDRGFRLVGKDNTLNITADKIVSYTGDEFVHVRGGVNNNSVANIKVGDFYAKTTWGKDDYGVSLLQVNEGGKINFTATKAVLDGSTHDSGGVIGSGSYGTLTANVGQLTINGNICGTYGTINTDASANTVFKMDVNADNLEMTGDINAGNMGDKDKKSLHNRKTEVTVKVKDKAILNGNINAYEHSTVNVDLGTQATLNGNIMAKTGEINLGGNIAFDAAKTSFSAVETGNINLVSGTMSGVLNLQDSSKVNLTGATFKVNDMGTAITGNGKLVVDKKGVLETVAGQVFTNGDTTLTKDNLTGNAVTDNVKGKVDFVGGTLKLTDNEYTLDYIDSAKGAFLAEGAYKDSKTGIVMAGKLVATSGEEIKDITVDQAGAVGGDVALDKVTVKDDGNNLVIGVSGAQSSATVDGVAISNNTTTAQHGFNAAGLDLGYQSTGAIITNGQAVTIGGSAGGNLVTVNGAEANVKLVVGTSSQFNGTDSAAGTLNIGNAITNKDTVNTITGSIAVNTGSDLNINGTTTVTQGVEINGGSIKVGDGLLKAEITAKGTNVVTGAAEITKLTGTDANTIINVGQNDAAGKLVINELDLKGGTLFLDPIWKDGGAQDEGTEVAIAVTTLNGKMNVGQNSTLSLGTDDVTKAQAAFAKTGLNWGNGAEDVLAAVYIAAPIILDGNMGTEGGLYVDPDVTNTSSTSVIDRSVTFKDGSILMVDGAAVTSTAAISGVASASIDAGSKLYVDGAEKGGTYKILAGTNITGGWANEDIIADNRLLAFTGAATSNTAFDVTASLEKVNKVFNNQVVIGNVVDNALAAADKSVAQDFFNNAVSNNVNATDAAIVNALNSAANIGELAGVNHGTYSMSNVMTDAIGEHLSLANDNQQDKNIWAHYIHNKENVRDIALGGMKGSYDLKYNGIVVGSDLYSKGNTTAGVALSYAKGDINSIDNTVHTKNDSEYYGLSLYGRIADGNTSVLGDISYLHGKNDIKQYNSDTVITASPKSDAFSIGVKAEKAYAVGKGQFVPFAGLRYMHLGVGNYTNSLGMNYNVEDQNLWLLPVGVSYSYATQQGDWTVRPSAEIGYVWTAGDRDTKQAVSLNGASDNFGFYVADSGSFVGRLGLSAEKKNMTLGLGYEYQKGDSIKANKWMANVNFSF